ncbi:acyltransferase [Massilia sp. R2A-15]|uniref:acyltransferase family protein n=1 Tax=Massilia sp. R2A-15 TaxID=3064278 RepID=UPI0027342D12|nr:acyltransferase [Massilia sp. R2A-15]WLI88912.1 acyltransferase [Massilia sp. R2A-15]
MTPNVRYLDGWRGLAILCVFIGHFTYRPALDWAGEFGVQLFFALSGFLMANLLFIKKVEMRDFFARRLSRVVPTFILFVIIMYVYATKFQTTRYVPPSMELFATFSFLRTYLPTELSIWSTFWPIGHIWSLNVEEHSYIFLAIGSMLTRRARGASLACIFLSGSVLLSIWFCICYAAHPPSGAAPWFIRSECAALALIAAAAIRTVRNAVEHPILESVSRLLPVLWVVIAMACISTYKHRGGQHIIAPLCLALAINYLDKIPGMMKTALSNPVLGWFGKCSFSLYLWQQPFFVAVVSDELPKLIGCTLAIASGAISFYAFENPVREKLNRKWTTRKKAHPSQDAVPPAGPVAERHTAVPGA